MKSFRLDRKSGSALLATWPAMLLASLLLGGLAYLGWFHEAARILFVVLGSLYLGFLWCGGLRRSLREKYPNAKALFLLSTGLATITLGVLVRMTFPEIQGGLLDLAWIAIAWCCVLLFVVINRRDPNVIE